MVERGGQNLRRMAFYARGIYREALPFAVMRQRLNRRLRDFRLDELSASMRARLDFYNRLSGEFATDAAVPVQRISRKKSMYYIDFMEFARSYGPDACLSFLPGDVTAVPPHPTIVKSRPIAPDNRNSVLFKLNKFRHFNFLNDPVPFRDKAPRAVWRGRLHNAARQDLLRRFVGHRQVDVGHIGPQFEGIDPLPFLDQRQQLQSRYLLALEGIDVATNLKWIMSSNSVAFSPPMKFETWFMESRLIPGTHFVEIAPDYSDLEEKIDHFNAHPDAAEEIIRNAHAWIDQFRDRQSEDLLCTLVLQKYLELAGELPNALLPNRYFT